MCKYFVLPERSESLMEHLERHIALDLKEVDALTARKVARRRRRLLAGLLHLHEEGVLTDSLPCAAPLSSTSNAGASLEVHGDHFLTRLLLGESYMRKEVVDRAARLVPTMSGIELNAVATYLMATRQLARLFDELAMQDVLKAALEKANASVAAASAATEATATTFSAPLPRLSREEKAAILLACVGELEHFHRQDRPRSVLSKVSADALVLNVVATHARDNLISELVHEALQRVVEEGSPVWRQHQQQVMLRAAGTRAAETPATGRAAASARDLHNKRGATQTRNSTSVAQDLSVRYVQQTRLASMPAPAPASATTALLHLTPTAAAEMVAGYVVMEDVDGPRCKDASLGDGEGVDGAAGSGHGTRDAKEGPNTSASLSPPLFESAENTAKKFWEPMRKELHEHAEFYRSLPMMTAVPRLHKKL